MKPKVFVEDLVSGKPVTSPFLLSALSSSVSRKGDPYLILTLTDKTGSIGAKLFSNAEATAKRVEVGIVVDVRGRVDTYQGKKQVIADALAPAPEGLYPPDLFVRRSRFSIDTMAGDLTRTAKSMKNRQIKRFLLALLAEDELMAKVKLAAAAKHIHHAYLGGLLEHTTSMLQVAGMLYDHYEALYPGLLDRDLLLAGVILHDLCKVYEMDGDKANEYTTEGRLVGHLVMGALLVERVAGSLDGFPSDIKQKLQHLVLSHHGKHEFGSPVVPKMAEALLLNFIDEMDAKLNTLHELFSQEGDGEWTGYHRLFERQFLNPYPGLEATDGTTKKERKQDPGPKTLDLFADS